MNDHRKNLKIIDRIRRNILIYYYFLAIKKMSKDHQRKTTSWAIEETSHLLACSG